MARSAVMVTLLVVMAFTKPLAGETNEIDYGYWNYREGTDNVNVASVRSVTRVLDAWGKRIFSEIKNLLHSQPSALLPDYSSLLQGLRMWLAKVFKLPTGTSLIGGDGVAVGCCEQHAQDSGGWWEFKYVSCDGQVVANVSLKYREILVSPIPVRPLSESLNDLFREVSLLQRRITELNNRLATLEPHLRRHGYREAIAREGERSGGRASVPQSTRGGRRRLVKYTPRYTVRVVHPMN